MKCSGLKYFLLLGLVFWCFFFLMTTWKKEASYSLYRLEKFSVIMLPYGFISPKPIFMKDLRYNPVKKYLNEDIWICDNSLQFPGNISGLLGVLLCLQNLDQKLLKSLWKSLFPVHQIVPSYNQ